MTTTAPTAHAVLQQPWPLAWAAFVTPKTCRCCVLWVARSSNTTRQQGCSHFLEHMLFMGSAAFPDENDYDAFLTRNGGGSNAFTELVR